MCAAADDGTWKKYNMKPVARRKCAAAMPMIRKNEYFESFNDGIRIWISA